MKTLLYYNIRSVCTVWSYVCSVCAERTVLLVPLILLGKVNVLVDTSAQIEVTKARERPDWTRQAAVTAFLLQQQLYVYGWPGCVYGGPVWGLFQNKVANYGGLLEHS